MFSMVLKALRWLDLSFFMVLHGSKSLLMILSAEKGLIVEKHALFYRNIKGKRKTFWFIDEDQPTF